MILIVAVILSTLAALLRGGRLGRLADLRIAHGWLALGAVAMQWPLVYEAAHLPAVFGVPVAWLAMALSYALLGWVAWANRRLPGVGLIGLGMISNLLVMSLNGGWMPITPEALRQLGRLGWVTPVGTTAKVWGAKNVMLPRAQTRLWWLSDVVVLPAPFPLPTAFSIGDLLIALGAFWLLQHALVAPAQPGAGYGNAGEDRGASPKYS